VCNCRQRSGVICCWSCLVRSWSSERREPWSGEDLEEDGHSVDFGGELWYYSDSWKVRDTRHHLERGQILTTTPLLNNFPFRYPNKLLYLTRWKLDFTVSYRLLTGNLKFYIITLPHHIKNRLHKPFEVFKSVSPHLFDNLCQNLLKSTNIAITPRHSLKMNWSDFMKRQPEISDY